MSTQALDPAQFKARQRREWDRAASGWKQWWPTIEQGAQSVNDRLLELARVEPGHRVLDVATGIGEPAVTAAQRVGPAGRVTATDQSPKMLAIARERAQEQGLENIQFHEMDAETLDFPEGSFDAALCRWGLMLLSDLGRSLNQMHRALASGGRLAAAVWDAPERVALLSTPVAVMRRMMEVPTPSKGGPGLFSLADAAALEQALGAAGFVHVHSERMTFTVAFPSAEAYTQLLKDCTPPIAALLADKSPELQQQVWQAIAAAVQQYATDDGSIRIPSTCILAAGQRA